MNYVILNTADSISKKNCRLNQTIVRVRQKKFYFILFDNYQIITYVSNGDMYHKSNNDPSNDNHLY